MVEVRITGADQLAALAKKLKAAGDEGKQLRKELLKEVRAGARPALADARKAVHSIPVTGSRGGGRKQRATKVYRDRFGKVLDKTEAFELGSDELEAERATIEARAKKGAGLRVTVSRALRLVTKTGSRSVRVSIEVDASKMPEDQRSLPRHLDSAKGWRHPTFGHKPWVHQRGKPWFEVTIRKHAPAIRAHILKAMDEIAAKIEK